MATKIKSDTKVPKKKITPNTPKSPVKTIKSKASPKTQNKAYNIKEEKKVSEADKAFDKKIDAIAKTSIPGQKKKSKIYPKIIFAVIIIVILAVIVYLFFPRVKSPTVKEENKSQSSVAVRQTEKIIPAEETKRPADENNNTYTVKVKDQLNNIGKEFYGNYSDWKKIYEANKDKIKDPNLIFPGQKFVIPKANTKN